MLLHLVKYFYIVMDLSRYGWIKELYLQGWINTNK